jgi:hypothetical protein
MLRHREEINDKDERFVAVLEIPPVVSPETAVKVAVAAEMRGKMNIREWQLQITEKGKIFVQHLTLPRFTTQIIIQAGQPNPCVSFKSKWEHPKLSEMEWYFKALEFYNNAPKPN